MKHKFKRGLSLILSCALVLTLLPATALAEGGEGSTGPSTVSTASDSPVQITKTVTPNDGGTYTLKMEAYVTKKVTVSTVPMDIVLVLDQSGSMDYNFSGKETSNTNNKRITALKNAVTSFVSTVQEDAVENGVDHKIAIVGFASGSSSESSSAWSNTELLSTSNVVGYSNNGISDTNYQDALVSVNVDNDVNNRLTTAISRVAASGATYGNYGLIMAKGVLDNRTETTYTKADGTTADRQTVVIFFTDGYPGRYAASNGGFYEGTYSDTTYNNVTVADSTIAAAAELKNDGVTIYSVGIFSGADPNEDYTFSVKTVSNQGGGGYGGNGDNGNTYYDPGNQAANAYMHFVSSNYGSSRTSMISTDTAVNTGYYLAASSADELANVFSKIQDSISSETVDADGDSVLSDTLSDMFDFDGVSSDNDGKVTGVTAETYAVTGKNGDTYTWASTGTNVSDSVQVSVDSATRKITVTGFDYSKNAVTTTTKSDGTKSYSGSKLVISFNIKPDITYTQWGATGDYKTNSEEEGKTAGLTYGEDKAELTASPKALVTTYTVTYSWGEGINDATPEVPEDSQHYISGQPATVDTSITSDTVITGSNGTYKFEGWTIDSTDAGTDVNINASDVVLTAKLSRLYTITYASGVTDGSVTNLPAAETNVPTGSHNVSSTEPERTGYTFAGWTTKDVDGETKTYSAGAGFGMPAKDVTFTATWTPRTDLSYTVNYLEKDTNEVLADARTVDNQTFGTTVTSANEAITINGYKYDSADQETLTIGTEEAENVINLYYIVDDSQTKTLSYTVEYYKDGEKVEEDTQTVSKTVQVLQPDTLTVDQSQINTTDKYEGYKLDKTEPATIPDTVNNGDTIKVYYVKENPSLEVEKTLTRVGDEIDFTAGVPMAKVGDTIIWTITVENTGNTKLTDLTLTDSISGVELYDGDSLLSGTFDLDVSTSKTFTAKYTVAVGDEGKTLQNSVTVKGGDETIGGDKSDEDVTVERKGLTVTKTADKTSAEVGDTLTYTITVKNTGNVELKNISVTDELKGAVIKEGNDYTVKNDGSAVIDSLAPNASVEITVTYEVQEDDAGKTISNTAVAKADDDTEGTDTNEDVEIPVPEQPGLSVNKTLTSVNGSAYATGSKVEVGDVLTYTITVKNTGNVTLNNIIVTDELDGAVIKAGTGYTINDNGNAVIASLNSGETVKVTVSYTVQEDDAGKTITNTAAATAGDDGPGDDDTSEVEVDKEDEPEPKASLDVTKTADRKTAEVGDTITWTIKVTNNGEVNLSDLTLDDTMSGVTVYDKNGDPISSTYTFDLTVGATAEFTAKYKVGASDEGKRLSNTVIVTVPGDPDDPDDDQKFEDTSDPVKVDEEEEGPYESLLVRKSVDNKTPEVGDTIEYTIKVTNTGDTTLRKVTVKDVLKNAAGSISVDEDDLPAGVTYNEKQGSFTIKTLGINESVTITYTYEVLRADAGKTLTNTVSVRSNDAFDREEETVKVKKDSVTPTTPVETDKPTLNIEDHVAYIIGYTDGTVRPENNITRAEVATIFFRLLTDESRARYWSQTNEYSDVNSGDWFNNAISTLSNAGIITGYPNGAFQPNAPITRAEFSTIAARFSDVVYSGGSSFIDVSASHWAARYIALAEYLGWITGYPDGTFKPDQNITRAEAMTLINRVLERAVEEQHMLPDMVAWIDNLPDAWYYEAVQEATNSHEYFRLFTLVPGQDFRYEHWQEILNVPDWAALEKAWSTVNGK